MELKNILTSAKVGELTLTEVPILDPSNTIDVASAEMRNHSHGSALVCLDGKLVGIFTERDLLKVIAGGAKLDSTISEVMTKNPETSSTEDSLFEAIQAMDQGGYRRLPVVNAEQDPVGLIDVKTVTHFLVEHFPETVYNQASHAQLIAQHREGA
jgi:CBS domain-containing protein